MSATTIYRVIAPMMLIVVACMGSAAAAQQKPLPVRDYPMKTIRMLCGTTPGAGSDIINRLLAQRLSERWGQAVIVENRPGAAGTIALDMLAQATPDGYTLSVSSLSNMTGWMTQRNAIFDVRAYTPIAQLTSLAYLVVVNPSLPVNSIKELIAYAKSKPGALNYASAGIGSSAHLGMELFKAKAGIDIVHVPYAGSPLGLMDVVAGRVQMQLNTVITSSSLRKQGKLKALAITSVQRNEVVPDVPTVSEAGLPGYELYNIQGVVGPAGMPPALVLLINRESSEFVNLPEIKSKMAAEGAEIVPVNSPEEFKRKLAQQIDIWWPIIATSNAKQ